MIKIAVILCTRGLVFTSVENAISGNLAGFNHKIFRSHDLKIPDSQNYLLEQAIQEDFTHFLFVEEDTVMPRYAVADMLLQNSAITCVDYGVAGYSCITRDKATGEILWCGLGCTLVKREVFTKLEKPYFRSDKALLLNDWPEIKWIEAGAQAYGGQDIWFCTHAREKGFQITQVKGECQHLQLDALGRREINNGLHQISQKPTISTNTVL